MDAVYWLMAVKGGSCVVDCISNNGLNVFVIECAVGFVTWLEIEDFAASAIEDAATSKYFAASKPAKENKLIRRWNIKWLTIHFFNFQINVIWNIFCNRV